MGLDKCFLPKELFLYMWSLAVANYCIKCGYPCGGVYLAVLGQYQFGHMALDSSLFCSAGKAYNILCVIWLPPFLLDVLFSEWCGGGGGGLLSQMSFSCCLMVVFYFQNLESHNSQSPSLQKLLMGVTCHSLSPRKVGNCNYSGGILYDQLEHVCNVPFSFSQTS